MSNNITVAVRIRPLNEGEIACNEHCIWNIDSVTHNIITAMPDSLSNLCNEEKLGTSSGIRYKFRIVIINWDRTLFG